MTQREMEVLQESVLARGRREQSFKALLVNFKKLQASSNPPPTAAAELEVCVRERGTSALDIIFVEGV